MNKRSIFSIFLFVLSFAVSINCEDLKVIGEDFPPYSYYDITGEITGCSAEVVKAVLKKAGLNEDIELMNWKDAYSQALNRKNVLLFSVGRIAEREDLFRWVDVIAPYEVFVYKRKNRFDIVIDSLSGISNYKIGGIENGARSQWLISNGVSKQSFVFAKNNEINVQRLYAGKIDLYPLPELSAEMLLNTTRFKKDEFEKVFYLKDLSKDLYLVMSKDSSDSLFFKISEAFKEIKLNGTYKRIYKKYKIEN